jgi:hypothetical protein
MKLALLAAGEIINQENNVKKTILLILHIVNFYQNGV